MERAFFFRRIHSLFGLWIVLFLMEHLFTNSQAGLLPEDNYYHFIRAVNFLRNLPYVHVIEIVLLGVPILFHAGWGVNYLVRGKTNSLPSGGTTPSLPQYARNHAYSWQRWASWIVLIGLIMHVSYMRFYRYPDEVVRNNQTFFVTDIEYDAKLEPLSKKLDFKILHVGDQVFAECKTVGTATLLVVRDAFHSVFLCILYSIFVMATCFHAFNGLWTFMITWGVILRVRSQKSASRACVVLMLLLMFLGLASIWGSHWSFAT